MKKIICPLTPSPEKEQLLRALQRRFAEACNLTAQIARDHNCTARVALHHLAYPRLRARFPDLGAQMACNAVYTVARTFREISAGRRLVPPLPRLIFSPTAPVFFDQRTLTLKNRQVSLFTLDGRLKFELAVSDTVIDMLRQDHIKEVVLTEHQGRFLLQFFLQEKAPQLPALLKADPGRQQIHIHSPQPMH